MHSLGATLRRIRALFSPLWDVVLRRFPCPGVYFHSFLVNARWRRETGNESEGNIFSIPTSFSPILSSVCVLIPLPASETQNTNLKPKPRKQAFAQQLAAPGINKNKRFRTLNNRRRRHGAAAWPAEPTRRRRRRRAESRLSRSRKLPSESSRETGANLPPSTKSQIKNPSRCVPSR